MQNELFGSLDQYIVNLFFIQFRTERNRSQRLSLPPRKDCRTVCGRQIIHFAPNRTNLGSLTTVEPNTFIENHVPHRFFQHIIVEITLDQRSFFYQLLFTETSLEFGLKGIELIRTFMFRSHRFGNFISLIVCCLDHLTTQLLIIFLMAIRPFNVFTQLFREFDLSRTMFFDLFMGKLDGVEHNGLRNLFHLALDHQNVIDRRPDHDIEVGIHILREGRIDYELAVNPRHTHF